MVSPSLYAKLDLETNGGTDEAVLGGMGHAQEPTEIAAVAPDAALGDLEAEDGVATRMEGGDACVDANFQLVGALDAVGVTTRIEDTLWAAAAPGPVHPVALAWTSPSTGAAKLPLAGGVKECPDGEAAGD